MPAGQSHQLSRSGVLRLQVAHREVNPGTGCPGLQQLAQGVHLMAARAERHDHCSIEHGTVSQLHLEQ